jgi:hypothetical protein
MGPITALLLATPIFGFALAPPQIAAFPASGMSVAAEVASSAPVLAAAQASSAAATPPSQAEYTAAVRKRAKLAKIHRTLGIATWATTLLATASGTVAYRNLYGIPFATDMQETPCVEGDAWFGQKTCYGQPWGHAILGFSAGAFYFTTLGLAITMPDPDDASVGKSAYARTLRTHKLLRWVHLAGMLTQMVLGTIIANPGLTGLDRSNDYDTLKVLAGLHLGSGYVTLGALTWAGSIMLF